MTVQTESDVRENLVAYSSALLRAHEFCQRAVTPQTDWILGWLGHAAAHGQLMVVPGDSGPSAAGIFGAAPAREVMLSRGRLTPDRLTGGDCLVCVWATSDRPGHSGLRSLIRLAQSRWPECRLLAWVTVKDGRLHHKPLRPLPAHTEGGQNLPTSDIFRQTDPSGGNTSYAELLAAGGPD